MDFLNKLHNTTKENVPHPVKFTNIDFNLEDIVRKLKDVDKYSYEDLVNIVHNSYETILDDIFMRDKEMRANIIVAFNNVLFVKAFIEVVSKAQLTDSQIFSCNKLSWDYISSQSNKELKELFLQLSMIINRNCINILSAKININLAKMVSLARFSSMDEKKNASRVNRILCNIPENLSLQNIVDIYSVFYNNSITPLFEAIMYDTVGGSNKSNYDTITSAIFYILNDHMTTLHIRSVLYSHAETYKLLNKKDKLRINISDYCVIHNYTRVLETINNLRDVEGIEMP